MNKKFGLASGAPVGPGRVIVVHGNVASDTSESRQPIIAKTNIDSICVQRVPVYSRYGVVESVAANSSVLTIQIVIKHTGCGRLNDVREFTWTNMHAKLWPGKLCNSKGGSTSCKRTSACAAGARKR